MSVETQKQQLTERGYLDLDDLQTNRQGVLTDLQIYRVYRANSYWFILLAANIICLTLLLVNQIRIHNMREAFVFWLTLLTGTGFYCVKNLQTMYADVRERKVKIITGILYKKHIITGRKGGGSAYCTIRVQNLIFTINPALYDILIHEESYRLYFTPHTKQIVNVEPY